MTNPVSERKPRHKSAASAALACFSLFIASSPISVDADGVESKLAGREPKVVGRQTDGSVVLPSNQIIRPAGVQVEFLGRPNAVALSPDGKIAAFLNNSYLPIILVDLGTGTVIQELEDETVGTSASFNGIMYSPDGSKLYASQANGRIFITNVASDGTISLDGNPIDLRPTVDGNPDPRGNPYPGGMALSEDGSKLYVVLNRYNTLAVVDLGTREVTAEIPVGNVPHAVIVQGQLAYVSNRGGRPSQEDDFTNDSSGTEIVADDYSGSAITGTVSVVNLSSGEEINTIEVGLHPTALLLDEKRQRLFVANTNSDSVSIIDLATQQVAKTINVQPFVGAPFGSSPDGLALMGDNELVVSLGRNNALAIYQLGKKHSSQAMLEGLVPTGWYPTDVIADEASKRLIVANGKGVGSLGPQETVGPDPATNKTGYWVHSNLGSASIISYPSWGRLHKYTNRVYHNNGWMSTKLRLPRSEDDKGNGNFASTGKIGKGRGAKPVPVPRRLGDPSVFKHVFYIIKENRTYDQILGDLPQGNGDQNVLQFGGEYTPNQHAIANGFVLFDNLYDAGSLSADGHQWNTQAYVVDYLEKAFGAWTRSYPYKGGDAMAYAPTGFLWENALRHGKSVRVYGEYVVDRDVTYKDENDPENGSWLKFYQDYQALRANPGLSVQELWDQGILHADNTARSDIPSLEAIQNPDYPPYTMTIPDVYRVEIFLREFEQYVQNGELPNLVIMHLPTDHTAGTSQNYPTPGAMIADNDLALARVVEAVSNSPYWQDSVFFVIEDDAQNGVDHVDGHRTIGYVISPYTKRGIVDSRYYTQIDFVRTMEQILGLPPMNQMDQAVPGDSMAHVFTNKPDFTPFEALANQVPLDQMNPLPVSLTGIAKAWADASRRLDLSEPDVMSNEALLNRMIWYSAMGYEKRYPKDPVGKRLLPDDV